MTASRIVTPEAADKNYVAAEVLAVGPGFYGEKSGTLTPTGLAVGDHVLVLFGQWRVGSELDARGDERVISARGVQAVIVGYALPQRPIVHRRHRKFVK